MACIIVPTSHAMVCKAPLPDFEMQIELLLHAIGEPAFNELQYFFQGNVFSGRNQKMEMVGHHNKLVEKATPLAAIVLKNIEEQFCHALRLKKRTPAIRHGG